MGGGKAVPKQRTNRLIPTGEGVPSEEQLGRVGVVDPTSAVLPVGDAGVNSGAVMANLLGDLVRPPPFRAPKERESIKPPGIYVGDGLPPVPAKLAAKILQWEFVEMQELLPEFWAEGAGSSKGTASRGKGKKRVADVMVWLQCYAQYVGILLSQFPEAVPEVMAYQVGVLRAYLEFEEGAWAAYDIAFRRQAAATGLRKWSVVNPSLYSLCFTGKAKRASRCEFCLGASHRSEDCALAVEEDPDLGKRMKAVESAVVAFTSNTQGGKPAQEICRLYQQDRCTFSQCKFGHWCRRCGPLGKHPLIACEKAHRQGGQAQPQQWPRPYQQQAQQPRVQQPPYAGPMRHGAARAQGYGGPY